ncbi:MAG: Rieske (2Fe-2S) protein [Myxococcales bacterium]|nr:Rieske (2Fe-2S) protein [Myxococcota bacterium]MDW8284178.1 Rieske (2Fe-2S) protein [Myxococcales bacterium]
MMQRRTLLKRLAGLLMGAMGAVLATPAVLYLLDPLRRLRGKQPGVPALPVARLDQLPDLDRGEAPLRQSVVARDVRDAWTRFPEVRQGSVWVYRRGDQVFCLSTVCPHAGCSVDYDEQQRRFVCPCHRSTFSLDGKRQDGPSPRDMDSLEVQVRQGQVFCRYQRFRLATASKEAI